MGQDDKHQHQKDPNQTGTGQMKDQDTSMGRDEGTLGEKGGQSQRTSEDQARYDDDMLDEDV